MRLGERIKEGGWTEPLYCITVNIKPPFGGIEELYCITVTTMHKNSCLNLYVRKTHEIHKGISSATTPCCLNSSYRKHNKPC